MGLWTPIGNGKAIFKDKPNGTAIDPLQFRFDEDTAHQVGDYDMIWLRLKVDRVLCASLQANGTWALNADMAKTNGTVQPWPLSSQARIVATAYTSLALEPEPSPWAPPDNLDGRVLLPRRAELGSALFLPPFDAQNVFPRDGAPIATWPVGGDPTKWLADIQGTLSGEMRTAHSDLLPDGLPFSGYIVAGYPPLGVLRFTISFIRQHNGVDVEWPFRADRFWSLWGWKY